MTNPNAPSQARLEQAAIQLSRYSEEQLARTKEMLRDVFEGERWPDQEDMLLAINAELSKRGK
jgi:hypothetical protein